MIRLKYGGGALPALSSNIGTTPPVRFNTSIISPGTRPRQLIEARLRDRDDAFWRRGESLARAAAVTSLEPLLALDYPVLETFVTDLEREDVDLVLVEVLRVDGNVVARAGTRGPKTGTSLHEAPITLGGSSSPAAETFGRVRLVLSRARLESALARQMRSVVLYAGIFIGLVTGGAAAWLKQGKWRKAARDYRGELDSTRSENDRLKQQLARSDMLLAGKDEGAAA